MQLSINIPQDEIEQISSRIAKKVTEEVMRQLKENLQKLGVKVEPEGKVGDVTHWVPIQYLQNKAEISADAETTTKQSTVEVAGHMIPLKVGKEYFLYKLPAGSSIEIRLYERTVQGVISAFPLKGGNIAIDVWDNVHENYWHLAFSRISTAKLISLPRE